MTCAEAVDIDVHCGVLYVSAGLCFWNLSSKGFEDVKDSILEVAIGPKKKNAITSMQHSFPLCLCVRVYI